MNEDASRRFAEAVANEARALRTRRRRRTLLMGAVAVFASTALATAIGVASVRPARSAADRAEARAAEEPLQDRPKPPAAAFDACRSRAEGDACTVELGGQKISGTCRKLPGGEQDLVCFPAGPPPGAPRQ